MTIREIFGMRVPTPWALKGAMECANPDLMVGVELEVENCMQGQDWYQERTGKLGWTTTVDNSLRGVNVTTGANAGIAGYAFEFISKPMKSSTLLFSMEEFFKVTGFDEKNYTDRCSVHVHVNCTDLTPDQISSVALVYSVVEDILFRFVGQDRENNIYCLPWSQCRMHHDRVDKITSNVDRTSRSWQKYTALNLIPLRSQGTVEFRQMHGTADMKKLTTWINLIGCIFKYGTNTELTELIKEIKALNSTSEYEVFFGRVLGNYLPYTPDYRTSLEGGIISAKYGLINWKKDKKEAKDASAGSAVYNTDWPAPIDDVEEDEEEPERPMFRQVPVPPPHNRFIPWPPVGTRLPILDLTEVERNYITSGTRGGRWVTRDGSIEIARPLPADTTPVAQPVARRAERPRPQRLVPTPAAPPPWRMDPQPAALNPQLEAALAAIAARADARNNQEG
jgi:hypothetical protein